MIKPHLMDTALHENIPLSTSKDFHPLSSILCESFYNFPQNYRIRSPEMRLKKVL